MSKSSAKSLWQDLLDKDDRTSPAEYPDMVLITFEEFNEAICYAIKTERDRCAGLAIRQAHIAGALPFSSIHTTCHDIASAIRSAVEMLALR